MARHWPTEEYASYLAGKRVALVGPAPSVEGSAQHDFIESHDVVVRVNHALPIPEPLTRDVGRRTDVLYHNLWPGSPKARPVPELVSLIVSNQVRWVCAAHAYLNLDHPFADEMDQFLNVLDGRVSFRAPKELPYLCLWWDCQTRPNAGVSAMADLLSFDISRLYATGFTFYSGPQAYHEGYRGKGAGPVHDQDRQRAYVSRLRRADARFTCDAELDRLLNEVAP